MPTFDTPEPITLTVELGVGDVRIVASDRTDTTVDVRPTNRDRKGDVTAAQQTQVAYADGRLLIKAPKGWRRYAPFGGGRDSIDVEVELPSGSELRGDGAVAALRSSGRLEECRFKISAGSIDIADAGPVDLRTSAGDITVGRVDGCAEITASSGDLRVGRIDGDAVIKNSNGDTKIGEVTGDLRVHSANGDIVVDRAQATVVAKTANGDLRLGEVSGGAVQAETARGRVEIGVAEGVAAWLDLRTSLGTVHNDLAAATQPAPGDQTIEVRARTALGDITIRRTPSSEAATTH